MKMAKKFDMEDQANKFCKILSEISGAPEDACDNIMKDFIAAKIDLESFKKNMTDKYTEVAVKKTQNIMSILFGNDEK